MPEFSPLGFADYLSKLPHVVELSRRQSLEKAAVVVKTEAKRSIGEYQAEAGPFAAWEPLAESTLEQKSKKGRAPPDNPLLVTGDLRESIEHNVVSDEAHVGSNSDVAVWQELGTNRIPARSFLGGAAVRKTDEVKNLIGEAFEKALAGRLSGLF